MHHHPRGNGSSNTVEGMALLGVVRMASLHCLWSVRSFHLFRNCEVEVVKSRVIGFDALFDGG